MSRFTNRLLAPNLWVGVFSLLGLVGIAFMLAGRKSVGLWFLAPLVAGAVVLVCVVIPVIILRNKSVSKIEKKEK